MLSKLRKISIRGELKEKWVFLLFYVDTDLCELSPDLCQFWFQVTQSKNAILDRKDNSRDRYGSDLTSDYSWKETDNSQKNKVNDMKSRKWGAWQMWDKLTDVRRMKEG